MKIFILNLLVIILLACSSDPSIQKQEDWDSGGQDMRSFQEESAGQRDESTQNQMSNPMTTPTNQEPF